jgi:hypothetical protein
MAVRSLMFKVQLAGHGVVNYDSSNQKYIWNTFAKETKEGFEGFDNVMFAKKRWSRDSEGKIERKLVISGDCLRHNIFIDDFMFQSPNVLADATLLNRMIATAASILRGYMFAQKDMVTFKRKSCISITEAQQTNGAISSVETFTKSGMKDATSLFAKECVGDIEYESIGAVDLKEMQFLSLSELFDRLSLNPDHFEPIYRPLLEKAFGSKLQNPGYYTIKGSSVPVPELGVLLTAEQTVFLTKEFFKRLLRLQINKSSNGWAKVKSVKIKYVNDILKDSLESEDGWVSLTDENAITFVPEVFYQEENPEESKKMLEDLEVAIAAQRALAKIAKEQKKVDKAEKAKNKATKIAE